MGAVLLLANRGRLWLPQTLLQEKSANVLIKYSEYIYLNIQWNLSC